MRTQHRSRYGDRPSTAPARVDPPFRPRNSIRIRGLSPHPRHSEHHSIHEPEGRLPGQRPNGMFFHTLKTERIYHRDYATLDESRRDLFGYIEGFYNSCTLLRAIYPRPTTSAERHNPVNFVGRRSVSQLPMIKQRGVGQLSVEGTLRCAVCENREYAR